MLAELGVTSKSVGEGDVDGPSDIHFLCEHELALCLIMEWIRSETEVTMDKKN